MLTPLRVGVVGVGRLGREHARIYAELARERGDIALAGVADLDGGRAREVGESLRVPHFTEAAPLLDEVDAVSVAVTTRAHASVAGAALERGVHVLVEKPITATGEEADRLVELARKRGILLGVGHVERFGPAARALLERVRKPRFIESHRLAPFNPRGSDVPVVLDLMIHDLDMLLALSPGEAVKVDAVGVAVLTPTADIANARIEFSSGLVANLTASRISRDRLRKMRVFQSDAYLSLDYLEQKLEVYRKRPGAPGFAEAFAAALAAGRPMDPGGWIEHETIAPGAEERLKTELNAWLDAVKDGGPAPVSGEDGRRALFLAERIMREMESSSRPS